MGKQWKAAGKQEKSNKKGALFTKLSREIQVAVRLGGCFPENNHRLKLALEVARQYSLPKDTIKRALQKGSGNRSQEQIEEVTYEGFGPHGVAMVVLCLTDNRVRTVSEVRYLFKKQGGSLGESGSVMWIFDHIALVQARKVEDQNVEEEAIEAGVENMEKEENFYSFYGRREDLFTLRGGLEARGWEILHTELIYRAKNRMELGGEQKKEVEVLLEAFEENPDCKAVYSNMEYRSIKGEN